MSSNRVLQKLSAMQAQKVLPTIPIISSDQSADQSIPAIQNPVIPSVPSAEKHSMKIVDSMDLKEYIKSLVSPVYESHIIQVEDLKANEIAIYGVKLVNQDPLTSFSYSIITNSDDEVSIESEIQKIEDHVVYIKIENTTSVDRKQLQISYQAFFN